MKTWMLFVLLLCVGSVVSFGCQSTGKVETSVNPHSLEMTEVKVVVEFRSN